MNGYLDTPVGQVSRRTNLDHLTDVEVIELLLENAKTSQFVDPEIVQEMHDRGLPEVNMSCRAATLALQKRKEKLSHGEKKERR